MIDPTKIYNDLISYLENLSEEELNIIVFDQWTVKDIVSHLIGWNEEASKVLPEVWISGETPWFMNIDNYDSFNQSFVDKYKPYSGKEILKMFKESEDMFNTVVKEIGEDRLRAHGKKYDWVFDEGEDNHYLEHFKQIKEAVES